MLLFWILLYPILSTALHFYLNGNEQKCFTEDMNKGLNVQGTISTEIFDDATKAWSTQDKIQIHVTVEVVSTLQRPVDKRISSKGSFNFVASDHGDHVICISVSGLDGWFSSTAVRVHLMFAYGDEIHGGDHRKEVLDDLTYQVEQLKEKYEAIHREQSHQRVKESEFRDLSERVNSRVVWWTIGQMFVLGGICYWQLRQLKTFFVSKKLV